MTGRARGAGGPGKAGVLAGAKPALARVFWVAAAAAALAFAVEGGEYGTSDLISMRLRQRSMQRAIDSLSREVDSLSRVRRAILTDRVVQERIAREEFGMVRGEKEILYRFAEPDNGGEGLLAADTTRGGP